MRHQPLLTLTALLLISSAHAKQDDLRVLGDSHQGTPPAQMMNQYLRGKVNGAHEAWNQVYEARTTAEQIEAYQNELRSHFLEALGELPQRTPLNARTVGTIEREGYTVEKILFESQPRHYVTGALFIPDPVRFQGPRSAVLVPCGHTGNAKAWHEYQRASALLAINGIVAFCYDPFDQGERMQWLNEDGSPRTWGTTGHTMVGLGSILLGRGAATYELWDGMRAIDFVQSRPEVDPDRIGVMGNSGGGTQTSHLMALDDRIKAASPSCYIMTFPSLVNSIGVQDAEQNIFGQLAFGMDHPDYLMMRAPTPILICCATKDFFAIDGTWNAFRYAKRLYSRMGFTERIDLHEDDAGHNYAAPARQAAVRWMLRWLDGRDEPIVEGEIVQMTDDEMRCTPQGQTLLIEGARSLYDINREYEAELNRRRAELWSSQTTEDMLSQVRATAGIRSLGDLPQPTVSIAGTIQRSGYTIEKLIIEPEPGIWLPALRFSPSRPTGAVLYLDARGKATDAAAGGDIEQLVRAGKSVLAVDIRSVGETAQNNQGYFKPLFAGDGQDWYTAYVLGKSYVGMRAEDILICARWLMNETGSPVDLKSIGHVGVPALHAAALEPQLFADVSFTDRLESWASLIEAGWTENQLTNVIHGALRIYDLPDLDALVQQDETQP